MSEQKNLGRIEISPNAIASIAGQAVLECYGVVGMAKKNFADRFSELVPRAHYRRGIDVAVIDHLIYIDLYVVIQYGTRISEVAHGIMKRVKYSVEKTVGLPVAQVNVHVQKLQMDGDGR
ncbi:MAG: Asp23/Gls24 family envelope stress response protein [Chloroflexi bacterium]|nr:Asp23/Gls24 family envelope stress response protein [Chloroflexota bacterium]MBI3740251.1 Asp23/Gls24 family envelope stress response protein [Chloroflexota bacterium]